MSNGELNVSISCDGRFLCRSVQCKDGGLDCDTDLCVVERGEGEEPGFFGHGRDALNRRIFAKDSFSLAKETECKITSYNHISLDNAVYYSYEEVGPYEKIKSGTVSSGKDIFFYGGYKLHPGTYVEFDRNGDISGLTLTLRGVGTKFLGIDWPVGTKIAMRGDEIGVLLGDLMTFRGFILGSGAHITFKKIDGKTFGLTTISIDDLRKEWAAEIGGIQFKDINRIEFDSEEHIHEVWGSDVRFSDKTPDAIKGYLVVKFQNGRLYSITPQNPYGTVLEGFGLYGTSLPFGSVIKFRSDRSISSIAAFADPSDIGKAEICNREHMECIEYRSPVEVWFNKDGMPDGHVSYLDEKPVQVYKNYPIYEGFSGSDEQLFAYGNEFWFAKNETGVPKYDELTSMVLSRDQWLVSPEFVTHQFFPKGTRLWLNSNKEIIVAKLSNGGSISLLPPLKEGSIGTIERRDFFPAGAIVFFKEMKVPCVLLDKSGYLYDITRELELGAESMACLPSAFALSPPPL